MVNFFALGVSVLALSTVACAGCKEGYTQRTWPNPQGNCHKVFRNAQIWLIADSQCRAEGGWLASLKDYEDSNWVNQFFIANRGSNCHDWYWVGGTDIVQDGIWRWQEDGTKATYTNWIPGQPNNYIDEDGLIVSSATMQWNGDKTFNLGYGAPAVCFGCEMHPTEWQCRIAS